jgi:hypothetical protein
MELPRQESKYMKKTDKDFLDSYLKAQAEFKKAEAVIKAKLLRSKNSNSCVLTVFPPKTE